MDPGERLGMRRHSIENSDMCHAMKGFQDTNMTNRER